jgi:sialidase-1
MACGDEAGKASSPEPSLRQVRLFAAGQACPELVERGGYHTYRIPALAVSTKGTLLAFCEARKHSQADSGDIDLVLRRSFDHGRSWGPAQVVVDDGGNTCGNPCPIVDRHTGAIVLLITKNKGSHNEGQIMRGESSPRTVWVTTSRDDGATWSTSGDISAQVRKPGWRWYATGPCHGIQLADGRLVAPCDHALGPSDDDLHSHVIFSDDGGATWRLGGVGESKTDESTVLELADGSLYLNMRNCRGTHRRAYSLSSDGGMTWSPLAEDAALVEPVCQASVLRLSTVKSGGENRVLFSNPASTRRENLTVRMSRDECKTWPVAKMLWAGPAAYSDLVVGADGMIGCLFECGAQGPREGIVFAQFSLEWLTDGADRR